ncbi:tetratricopeptide repeat protein [Alkaliflexus imshenetskii]|uniref:tetratricopeptide repeat protein n=1 Tax=Alkaliflexus imshenetskii TaxID=286730 RepID=UPI00047BB9BA|nr:tetratricopeptide repeat protein [Alkaliflexus imshenetskii]
MKKYLKHIITTLFIVSSLAVIANDDRFEKANRYYTENQYEEAIEAYEEILKSGVESSYVYYNLGNAYYRQGLLPSAILNYERALLLTPHDRDIRHNLNLAYSQITDKIEPVGEFFLARWFSNLRNNTDSDTWAIISIVSFILFLAGLLFYFFAKTILVRKLTFFLAVLAVLASGITFAFSNNQKHRLINRNRAIVFSPSVTVRSAPEAGGTELFVLHEGTRVKILQTIGHWLEVEIEDGNVGWIHASHLEVI